MFELRHHLLCKPVSLHQQYNPAEMASSLCLSLLICKIGNADSIHPDSGCMGRELGGARVRQCDMLGVWADSALYLWDPGNPLLPGMQSCLYVNPFCHCKLLGGGLVLSLTVLCLHCTIKLYLNIQPPERTQCHDFQVEDVHCGRHVDT